MNKIFYLLWNSLAVGVGNLLDGLFLHILAMVVRVAVAGAGDGGPDLVVSRALPLVLAVFLVLGAALRLAVVLRLVPPLLLALLLLHHVALLLLHRPAFLQQKSQAK